MVSDPAAGQPGLLDEIAGRYQPRELIGRGGMGDVHAGWDRRLERPVAIKTLRADVAAELSARRRFESEARSAARLVHPNVVAVYDSGEDRGIPFMVMELLPGRSLKDEISAGPMDVRSVQSLASQVLSALGAAHSAGIVHRDIKPANILAAGDGQWKVGDFGIAKSVQVHGSEETVTGLVLGTPAYVAPERLFGGDATPAGDLYSLGVILYEALAGRRPFHADSPEGWAAAISTQTVEPLRDIRPDVPPAMASSIDRSIARHPTARFASAAEMAGAMGVTRNGGRAGLPVAATAAGGGLAGAAVTDTAATEPAFSWHEVAPATSAETTAFIASGGPAATQAMTAAGDAVSYGVSSEEKAASGPAGLGARWSERRRSLGILAGGAAVACLLGISIAAATTGGKVPATTHVTTPPTVATVPPTTSPTTTTPPPPPPPSHHDKGGGGGDKGGGGGGGG
ncbi:MAG TPA: serine/threonine-protein kinase [Acidimicrobiales bacterium]|nr:serine/threonine-protein kinase [Acidimicrobiales bacterium]